MPSPTHHCGNVRQHHYLTQDGCSQRLLVLMQTGAKRSLNKCSQECGFVREAKRKPALPYAPEVTLQPHIHTLHMYMCAYIHTSHSTYICISIHVGVQYTAQRNCISIEKNPLYPVVFTVVFTKELRECQCPSHNV